LTRYLCIHIYPLIIQFTYPLNVKRRKGGVKERTVFDPFGNAEIQYLDHTLIINKDVSALDIVMNDFLGVEVVEPLKDLTGEVIDKGLLKRAVVFEQGGHRASGNILVRV
jgi:hypothetical protein